MSMASAALQRLGIRNKMELDFSVPKSLLCLYTLGLWELTAPAQLRGRMKYWNGSLQSGNKPQSKPSLLIRSPKRHSSFPKPAPPHCWEQWAFIYPQASCPTSGQKPNAHLWVTQKGIPLLIPQILHPLPSVSQTGESIKITWRTC